LVAIESLVRAGISLVSRDLDGDPVVAFVGKTVSDVEGK
jgi:hypothetical protein